MSRNKILFFLLTPFISLLFWSSIDPAHTAIAPQSDSQTKYKTSFGKCPSRSVGTLALRLINVFEETHSMMAVKKEIISKKLEEKHFLSSYKVKYSPLGKAVNFVFECPEPLMKVQIYKDNGHDSYEAILTEKGTLVDPTYEVLLRAEGKLTGDLPFLAIPVGEMDREFQMKITNIVNSLAPKFRKRLSEVILNNNDELTIILSVRGNPSSVFFGENEWDIKMGKLIKIVNYMEEKKKIPAVINLTNSEKIVVKFSDKF